MRNRISGGLCRGFAPAIIVGLVLAASCANDECLENKNSLPLAGFYSSEEVPRQVALEMISVYGIGAPGDSVLHDSVSGLNQSYMPFRIDQESTSYVIKYEHGDLGLLGIADTITFNYDIMPWFVSSACGVVYNYKMRDISTTHYVIDSVTCPKGIIDNANAENLRIYFRVSTGGEDTES